MDLYHFTDTARLPWILFRGELRPGRNNIGGLPDPDFLWATTDKRGDATASGGRGGDYYRSGRLRLVRITVPSSSFFPWAEALQRCPKWTAEHIHVLERAAKGVSSPATWWCSETPLSLDACLKIETRSYQNNTWVDLPERSPIEIRQSGQIWRGVRIAGRLYASTETSGAHGALSYRINEP